MSRWDGLVYLVRPGVLDFVWDFLAIVAPSTELHPCHQFAVFQELFITSVDRGAAETRTDLSGEDARKGGAHRNSGDRNETRKLAGLEKSMSTCRARDSSQRASGP